MSKTAMTVSKQAPISSGVTSGGERGCEDGFVIGGKTVGGNLQAKGPSGSRW